MKPNGGGKPGGKLAAAIDRDFGGYDNFRKEFVNKALTVFGSGWAWLVSTPSGLKVCTSTGSQCVCMHVCYLRDLSRSLLFFSVAFLHVILHWKNAYYYYYY